MTFRTVLNRILSGNGVVLPLPGDLSRDQERLGHVQPKTSQSEIINLFAEELRGRHPIHSSAEAEDEDQHARTN